MRARPVERWFVHLLSLKCCQAQSQLEAEGMDRDEAFQLVIEALGVLADELLDELARSRSSANGVCHED